MSVAIVRIGRSKLYAGFVRIDDPGAGPPSFTWKGVILGTAGRPAPERSRASPLRSARRAPIGPYLLEWSVTDAGP